MVRKVFAIVAVVAVAVVAGASVSAWAGSTPTPGVKAAPPLHPRTAAGSVRPYTSATNVHCGETVTASVVLNGDLYCDANTDYTALEVRTPGITVNLNGHRIAGTGGGFGVIIVASNDVVENGVVTGFNVGVGLGTGEGRQSSDTVTKIRATYNGTGIVDSNDKTRITSNTVYANNRGIEEEGSGATISGNIATSNGAEGILLIFASGTVVSGNAADSNLGAGIDTVNSVETTLTNNVANFNKLDGIVNGDRDGIDGGGNTAEGNDYATGAPPEECSGIACS